LLFQSIVCIFGHRQFQTLDEQATLQMHFGAFGFEDGGGNDVKANADNRKLVTNYYICKKESMKIKKKELIKSLNKTFRKEQISRTDFDNFKSELQLLLSKVNENESEEHLKYPLRDFLIRTSFSSNEINTKGRTDLAIYSGDTTKKPINVIFEIKKPQSNEFPTQKNINRKALQETVLYYIRERIEEKNDEIKHIILTNVYEWYIFDAHDFEKEFYTNHLIKEYEKWKAGQKTSKNTDHFYKIVELFANNSNSEIPVTYFDLRNYVGKGVNEKTFVPLFKILSDTHLLKQSYITDSNSLNTQFYNELLYIVGLQEVKEGTKKVIKRTSEKERRASSFVENAIATLQTENRLSKIPELHKFGETEEEQLFNVALELSIAWINRILFIKLLEAQLVRFHKNESYKFLDFSIITNYSELNELFFDILAKKINERANFIKKELKNIPYLNSSLFEISKLEDVTIRINSLKDHFTIPVFSQTVLKDQSGNRLKAEKPTLEYLFDFLNAYNFSNEGADEIQEENKSLINASVLGLIFEKINGYKEGSFFTPGYITMYMSRETIRRAVIQKFKEAGYKLTDKFELLKSWEELKTKIENREEANRIINSIKIIDPAVGSGHFLVSALNELIAIKSELDVLSYKSGKRILDYKAEVVNDDLIITNLESEDIFEYTLNEKGNIIPYKQDLQEAIFNEKQTIIENCLFGVDINPNSVNICRLRLWIELLKHTFYHPVETRHGMSLQLQTLPNIDINIKQGNSLISNFGMNGNGHVNGQSQKIRLATQKYKDQVILYKSTDNKKAKRDAEQKILEIKQMFSEVVRPLDKDYKLLKEKEAQLGEMPMLFTHEDKENWEKKRSEIQIEIENLNKILESKKKSIYINAFEWRFEFPEVLDENGNFVGFDVVIGNPPYMYNRDLRPNERDYYKNKYKTADDLYAYFLYEGINLLKSNGYFSFITPNTYFSLIIKENFRKTLLNYTSQKFTYSGFCFSEAYVETQIFIFQKRVNGNNQIAFVENPNDYNEYLTLKGEKELFSTNYASRLFYPNEINLYLFENIISKLSNEYHVFKETLQGKKSQLKQRKQYINNLKINDLVPLGLICSGEQGLVTGNNSKYIATIVTSKQEKQQIAEKFIERYNEISSKNLPIIEYLANPEFYFDDAEEIKKNENNPSVFGKFFNYKFVDLDSVTHYTKLKDAEKREGTKNQTWIFYHRGNSEGYKWYVPYKEALVWNKENVKELKEGKKTNSRWQGVDYFNSTGFGWVDYFTDKLKAFFVEEGVYSKNIVKMHSETDLISDKVMTCLLNSKLLTHIIKQFITSTHTLQINDGRLIPIKIPTKSIHNKLEMLFDKIFEIKLKAPEAEVVEFENEIDNLVYKLYQIPNEIIEIIEEK